MSDVDAVSTTSDKIEDWCNRVAAELLVPLSVLRQEYRPTADLTDEVNRLARRFGGGGHEKAAGALIPGSLSDVQTRVVSAAREHMGPVRTASNGRSLEGDQ